MEEEERAALQPLSNARAVFAFPERAPLAPLLAPPIDLGGPNSLRAIRRYGAAFRGVTSFETAVVSSRPLSWFNH